MFGEGWHYPRLVQLVLHGRKIFHHIYYKLIRYILKVVQYFQCANPHIYGMVIYIPFFAERFYKLVALPYVVARHHGEEMVIHLVLQPSTEPINKELRDSMTPVMFLVVVTWSFQKSGRVVASYTAMPLWPNPNTSARNSPEEHVEMKKYINERAIDQRPKPVVRTIIQA